MFSALIVEDEAISALAISGMIEDAGWVIAGVAASGELALELVAETDPDVVLMDIQLKGSLSGIEVAAAIARSSGIPIIFTTAYSVTEVLADDEVPDQCYFLSKPIDESRLHEVLAALTKGQLAGDAGA